MEADTRRQDLVRLVSVLEPPDENLAQRWGLLPWNYEFDFSTNLPFSPEMDQDYRDLIRSKHLLELPGPNSIRVHPSCPPEAIGEVDDRLRELKDVSPPVRLALAILGHLADSKRSDLGEALRHWYLIPAPVAEQALEIFQAREEVPVSSP